MATIEILINDGEQKFCEWQLAMTGDFFTALIDAIMRADGDNAELLRLGYPELVDAVLRYQNEDGYWEDLKRRYERQNNLQGRLHW